MPASAWPVPLNSCPRRLATAIDVNVFGLIAVTQTFAVDPHGSRTHHQHGQSPDEPPCRSWPPYAASKHALEAITDALRLELQPWGIRVALITPGAIATPIWGRPEKKSIPGMRPGARTSRTCTRKGSPASRKRPQQQGEQAQPAKVVAEAVAHALRSRWPHTRYLVGLRCRDSFMAGTSCPDRLNDWIITCIVKLPRAADKVTGGPFAPYRSPALPVER